MRRRTASASPLPGSRPRWRTSSRTSRSTIWSAVCWAVVVMGWRWRRRPGRAEHAGADLVDGHADAGLRDAELAQLLVATDEGVQPDRVGPGDGDDQVAALQGQAGDGVAAQAHLVVEQLLVLLQAENLSAPGPGVMRRDLRTYCPLLTVVDRSAPGVRGPTTAHAGCERPRF